MQLTGGYAARFLSVFVALGLFRLDSESKFQPIAANTYREAGYNPGDKGGRNGL